MSRCPGFSDPKTVNPNEEIPDILDPGDRHGISTPSRNNNVLELAVPMDLIAEVAIIIGPHGIGMTPEFFGIRSSQGK